MLEHEIKKSDPNSPLHRYITVTMEKNIGTKVSTLSGSRSLHFRRPSMSSPSRYDSNNLSSKIFISFNCRNA